MWSLNRSPGAQLSFLTGNEPSGDRLHSAPYLSRQSKSVSRSQQWHRWKNEGEAWLANKKTKGTLFQCPL
jgi:hypothetical protein